MQRPKGDAEDSRESATMRMIMINDDKVSGNNDDEEEHGDFQD